MKFANIDEAIMEAAKKPAPAKPAAKPATKKAEPKKAPAAPAKPATKKAEPKKAPAAPAKPAAKPAPKKAEPKKVEAPAPKKKALAPAPAAPKKAEPKKAEPKKEPEKPAQPWSTKGREARSKELASMSSQEREKESEKSKRKMGLTPASRGIGDRLKSAWKAFTAKPGSSVDVKKSYKSVFHEIQKLMEQLQLVEAMLQEQSLNESYDATTVNTLHERRDAIRSVLAEQMVREELYKHNVTVAELDETQRAALMETVALRSNALWEELNQVEEGKLSRLAAGLGLAGAAMMGKAKDAGAQQATSTQAPTAQVPNDSVQVGTGKSIDSAQRKAGFELNRRRISQQGARQDVVQNPDGTYSVTIDARKQPTQSGAPRMEERYSLEEWMGMMQEAGYSVKEGNAATKQMKKQNIMNVGRAQGSAGMSPSDAEGQSDSEATRTGRRHRRDMGIPDPLADRKPGYMQQAHASGEYDDVLGYVPLPSGDTPKERYRNPRVDFGTYLRRGAMTDRPKLPESYTLEEWMGMVKEAGYALHKKEK